MVSGQYFDRLRLHSQVKMLYKVKFSKLEFCQSDCRFEILAKNCVKKVSFFFQNFDQNIVKIDFILQNKVKFSKLEICQFDFRFKILGKKLKKSLFFKNFKWNMVRINVKYQKQSKIVLLFKFDLISLNNVNFVYILIKILKKERHFLHTVFLQGI